MDHIFQPNEEPYPEREYLITRYILVVFLLTTFTVWFCKLLWSRRKLYLYSRNVKGPLNLPIVGGGYVFLFKTPNEIYNTLIKLQKQFPDICKLWIGPELNYILSNPKNIETVLNSPNAIDKTRIYAIISDVLGEGILTAPGPKWKSTRKMVSPAFNKITLDTYVSIFAKKAGIFAQQIEKKFDKKDVNWYHRAVKLTFDIVCETGMGVNMNAQTDSHNDLAEVIETIMEIGTERLFKYWYQVPIIWKMSSLKKKYDLVSMKFWRFADDVIDKRKKMANNYKNNGFNENFNENKNDNDNYSVKRKPAFLDAFFDSDDVSEQQLRAEIQTFLAAATETTGTALCSLLACIGMFEDVQENIYQEVLDVIGSDRAVEAQDLALMNYTERVIKETLRLFPVAPVLCRLTNEDIDLGDTILPPGSNIIVNTVYVQRCPAYWENPLKFDPDRFLPEETAKRHPCAFLPFSFGPRNCIGAKYALLNLKTTIATVIRQFKIFSDYKSIDEIELDINTFVKFKNGYKLWFERR